MDARSTTAGARAPGDLIGDRYRLEQPLGRGGMAEVWAARDERLDRPVALKLLAPHLAAEEDFRLRFEQEARAAARLAHPNVVAVFDTGEDRRQPFLVMERLPGETLADRLAQGRLSEAAARRLAADVLAALQAAHEAGVLHRDIKPANILLAPDGTAKVADFGIAKLTDPSGEGLPGDLVRRDPTATNVLVGTPAYLAPERVDGAPATPGTDVYAVGVVLYEALTGDKPFAGETPVAVALAAQAGAVPLSRRRPGLDPGLAAAVERAMAPDPAARFTSAAAMAAAVAGGRGSGAADSTVVTRRPRRGATTVAAHRGVPAAGGSFAPASARNRRRVGAFLVAVAVLGLAFIGLAVYGQATDGRDAGATAEPLVAELRAFAQRLDGPDGRRARDAKQGLLEVAALLESDQGSQAADKATSLATSIRAWFADGLLGRTATEKSIALLARVPGAEVDSAAQTPTSTTTTTAAVQIRVGGDEKEEDRKGKGDGKGGND